MKYQSRVRIMTVMANKRSGNDAHKKPFPSRKNVRYVGLPVELHAELKQAANEEDRSVSWMARRAVREFLAARKREG